MKYLGAAIFVVTFSLLSSCNAQFRGRLRSLRGDEPCLEPGFFRDTQECSKFYRCADHKTQIEGVTYIRKFEFQCPAGTIFDESISTCNHYDFVQDRPADCQRPVIQQDPPQSVDQPEEQQPADNRIKHTIWNFQTNPLFYTNSITVPSYSFLPGARLINYV